MRIIVTGSRDYTDRGYLFDVLDGHYGDWSGDNLFVADHPAPDFYDEFTIVHGACPRGADKWADEWVVGMMEEIPGGDIHVVRYPANWTDLGHAAGVIRNQHMVNMGADLVLAFFQYGAANRGTAHCVGAAVQAGIQVLSYWARPRIQTVELP